MQQIKSIFPCDSCNKVAPADLVDLHSIRILKEEQFALCSDQTGDGVNHFSISTRQSGDLFEVDQSV